MDGGMEPRQRLVGIEALRFLSAVAVMVYHLGYCTWAEGIVKNNVTYPEIISFSWWGWIGVYVFFVISGLVIAYSAEKATAARFFESRFLRLFPGALVCATITLIVGLVSQLEQAPELLARYARSISFYPFGPWIDGVYWTLAIEIAFYGIVFLILAIGSFRYIEPIMACIGIASTLAWVLLPSLYGREPSLPYRLTELLLIKHGMYFAIGVFIWLLISRGTTICRLLVLFSCLWGGAILILHRTNAPDDVPETHFVPLITWLMSIALLVLLTRYDSVVSSKLTARSLRWIRNAGLATYPLYLLHGVVGATFLGGLALLGVQRYLALIIALISMIALSIFVTFSFEERLRNQLKALVLSTNRIGLSWGKAT
jgi:peptidoglycan/LPS O-acetylase OafA/YrhL